MNTLTSLVVVLAAAVATDNDCSGSWRGYAAVGEERTPFRLTVVVTDGKPEARIDIVELGAFEIPVDRVRVEGQRLTLTFHSDGGTHTIALDLSGDHLGGTWEMAGEQEIAIVELDRVEPWSRSRIEDIVIEGAGVRLAGSFVFPPGEGPFPTVIHVHGSGDETRHASRMAAQRFTEFGIASFVYDKRGTGASSGRWQDVGFEELAADILAVAEEVAKHPDVDAGAIGLCGTSQGGWTAPLAASRSDRIAFVITVSGPLVTPAEEGHWDSILSVRGAGYDDDVVEAVEEILDLWDVGVSSGDWSLYREAIEFVRTEPWFRAAALPAEWSGPSTDWYRRIMGCDPVPIFEELDVPVLALLGRLDESIPAEKSARILERIAREREKPFEVVLYPDADHALCVVRDPSAPFRWPGRVPGIFERKAAFVLQVTGRSGE